MNEIDLSVSAAITDHTAAGLIVACVGYRAYFLVSVHRGDLNFYVVGTCHRSRAVLCRELNSSEVESESFNEVFCLYYKLFKCFVRAFGSGVLEHFNLVELMSANHSALVRTVRACLASEAGCVAYELLRKVCFCENFVSVKGGKSRFCGGKHIADTVVRGVFYLINFVCKFGELSRSYATFILKHVGRKNKLVAVCEVCIDEVVEKCPFKTRAHAAIDPEARTGELCSALVVDKTEVCAKINVVLGLKIELVRLTEVAKRLVVLFSACFEVAVGEVGQTEHNVIKICFNSLDLFVVSLCAVGKLLHLREDLCGVLSFLFILRNELRGLVLLCFEGLCFGDECSALCVKLENARDFFLCVLSLYSKSFDDFLRIFFDISDV